MKNIFKDEEITNIIEIVIAILNLGNIEILAEKSVSKIEQNQFSSQFGDLMGLDFGQVSDMITRKHKVVMNEEISVDLEPC